MSIETFNQAFILVKMALFLIDGCLVSRFEVILELRFMMELPVVNGTP